MHEAGGYAGRDRGGGKNAVAGKGDEGADVAHDEIETGGQDRGEACAGEVSEDGGGRVEGRGPHCRRDVGALLQGFGEDGDGWVFAPGQRIGGGGVGFGVCSIWTVGCCLSAMVSAILVITSCKTDGRATGNVTLVFGGGCGGRAVGGGAAELGAWALGGCDLEKVNLANGKCERSGVYTSENARPRVNAAIAFCRFTFTFLRFSCIQALFENTEGKACPSSDITDWRARFTVNASGSCRTCEKQLTHVIRSKKGIDRHDVKYHIVHL